MADKDVVRLEAQLRLVRRMVRAEVGGPHFVATALSRAEVAVVLRCSPEEVDRLVARWELRPRRLGTAPRFPVSQIRALLDKQR